MFLGDILCIGIIKKGLSKVGSMPDTATPQDMEKALSTHIETAMVSFVGPKEAKAIALKIRGKLVKLEGNKEVT